MSRDINLLHPRLQNVVRQLQTEFPMLLVTETFRTVAEQDTLYAQGRTKPGNIVTNARGSDYESQHQWGIAFDYAYNQSGNLYPIDFMNKVSARAKQLGLAWGGDWTSFVDKPHLYLPDWGDTPTKLKQQYGTFEKFKVTWNSSNAGNENNSNNQNNNDNLGLVDWLKSKGMNSDFSSRGDLAVKYGVVSNKNLYTGTASQNIALLNAIKNGNTETNKQNYYSNTNYSGTSIVDGLKSINVDSSFANRKKIASANGINDYTGTASQNDKLLSLLKNGKLIKL